MRAPDFWFRSPKEAGLAASLLSPLSSIYAAATARRVARTGYRAGVPVVCVGNINIGGTGKTPTAIFLAQLLSDHNVHFVSRGYGGQLAGPLQVDPMTHKAEDVGDEPLLLAAFAPTWIAKDRAAGVQKAEQAGAGLIILDDGFQNPAVAKDLSIVTVDAKLGFGNGRVLPAGPLREPVAVGLKRADFLFSIGDEAAQRQFEENWACGDDIERLKGSLTPIETGMDWANGRFLAFAGIGHPQKFFRTLKSMGADLVHAEALSDHQKLPVGLMTRLESDAARLGAQLVTTEKDAVRLPKEFRQKVLTVPVRLAIEDTSALEGALENLLSAN